MKRRVASVLLTVLLVAASAAWSQSARAATLSYNDSITLQPTDWSGNLAFPKYNPAIGTLLSVEIVLQGHVQGDAQYESFNQKTTNVHLELKSSITLTKPDATVMNVLPMIVKNATPGPYDGVFDFGGTSGHSYLGIFGDATSSQTLMTPAELAYFLGIGSVVLPVDADGQSAGNGPGTLALLFNTNASARVDVTYTYLPTTQVPVPEPATASLVGLGLLGFAARRRFKNKNRSK